MSCRAPLEERLWISFGMARDLCLESVVGAGTSRSSAVGG